MIKELGVFPHNIPAGCPLIVGDLVFVVTATEWTKTTRTSPLPTRRAFVAVRQGDRPGEVAECRARPQYSARPVVEPGVFQRRCPPSDLPGWGRMAVRLRPAHRSVTVEFDGNPKDAVYALGGRGSRSHFCLHTRRLRRPAVHRHRPGPGAHRRRRPPVGAIDLARAVELGRITRTATSPRATRNSTQPIL